MEYTLESMYGIAGKVIAVTGGCGGIGRGFAESLASLGAQVAILDLKQDICDQVAAELAAQTGATVRGYGLDITDEKQVMETFDKVDEDFGSVYGLVNCAGISHVEFLSTMPIDAWQKVMDVNVRGTLLCTREAGKHMAKNRIGRVVNISSLGSHVGKPGYTAYTPSKAAINGFTWTLAIEWGRKNITVNAISPVFVLTAINRKQWANVPNIEEVMANNNPAGKCCSPELMSGLLVFLLSESASFVNGQVIGCDGGASAGMFSDMMPQETYKD